jgi:sporulation protein YlmC with PRC-barrel domain
MKRGPQTHADQSRGPDCFDLGRDVLDQQLEDAYGIPCGRVDDVELAVSPDNTITAVALLVGPGAWLPRMPALVCWIGMRMGFTGIIRIPWQEIAEIGVAIRLHRPAREYGLLEREERARKLIRKVPYA